jgi:hypothetical protein
MSYNRVEKNKAQQPIDEGYIESVSLGWGIDVEATLQRDGLLSSEMFVFSFSSAPQQLREKVRRQAISGGDRLHRQPRAPGETFGTVALHGYYLSHEGDVAFGWGAQSQINQVH